MWDRERDGAETETNGASGERMSNAMGTASDQGGARGCGVALMVEAAVCVDKG